MFLRLRSGFLIGLALAVGAAMAPEATTAQAASADPDPGAAPGTAGVKTHAPQANPAHGGNGKEEIDPLGLSTPKKRTAQRDLALWTGAVFLVFYLVLWKFAWKPIAAGLAKRERHVADQISQAEASNEEARRLLAEHQEKLAASEAEVRGILDQGRRDAEQLGQQILQKAKADTEAEKQRALREIEAATAGAIKELAEQSATMAVELAGKLVHAELDPKAHGRLIEQAVSDFSKMAPSKN